MASASAPSASPGLACCGGHTGKLRLLDTTDGLLTMIPIGTMRHSKVVAAFLDRLPETVPALDRRRPDGPRTMWAAIHARALVEAPAAQKILRFSVAPPS